MPTPPTSFPGSVAGRSICWVRGPGGAGPSPQLGSGVTVAHVTMFRDFVTGSVNGESTAASGPFHTHDSKTAASVARSSPGLVFHAKLGYGMFSKIRVGMPLEIGDVIKPAATTVVAIHFELGGEAGINAGRPAVIVSERSVDQGGNSALVRLLAKGEIWANIEHENTQRVWIQTHGGVLGDKG